MRLGKRASFQGASRAETLQWLSLRKATLWDKEVLILLNTWRDQDNNRDLEKPHNCCQDSKKNPKVVLRSSIRCLRLVCPEHKVLETRKQQLCTSGSPLLVIYFGNSRNHVGKPKWWRTARDRPMPAMQSPRKALQEFCVVFPPRCIVFQRSLNGVQI